MYFAYIRKLFRNVDEVSGKYRYAGDEDFL